MLFEVERETDGLVEVVTVEVLVCTKIQSYLDAQQCNARGYHAV